MKLLKAKYTGVKPREFLRNAQAHGATREQAKRLLREMLAHEVYLSDCGTYQVAVDKSPPHGFGASIETVWHLSIKRVDRQPLHDWRALQAIKNAIAGPECEAIELYPAESRVVDTANQYHLFVFVDPDYRIPVGWMLGMKTERSFAGSVQRPFDDRED